jgi:uncharacterized membrane protein YdjX (TVP38/TMEM64 family)
MKKKDIILTVTKIVVALTLFVIAIVNYDTLSNIDVKEILSFTDNKIVMTAVILLIYIVKALVFVAPASLIYVAVGAILSPVHAVAVNLVGIFIEVTVTFFLGRFLGKDAVHRLLSKKEIGRKILAKNIGSKTSVLLTIRAVPAFPIDFVSLFYGASGCRYLKYALLSVAGISWRVILFTILGDAAFSWIPMDKIILIVICCLPVFAVYTAVKKFVIEPKKQSKTAEAGK